MSSTRTKTVIGWAVGPQTPDWDDAEGPPLHLPPEQTFEHAPTVAVRVECTPPPAQRGSQLLPPVNYLLAQYAQPQTHAAPTLYAQQPPQYAPPRPPHGTPQQYQPQYLQPPAYGAQTPYVQPSHQHGLGPTGYQLPGYLQPVAGYPPAMQPPLLDGLAARGSSPAMTKKAAKRAKELADAKLKAEAKQARLAAEAARKQAAIDAVAAKKQAVIAAAAARQAAKQAAKQAGKAAAVAKIAAKAAARHQARELTATKRVASTRAATVGKPGRAIPGADATAGGIAPRVRFIRLTYVHLLLAIGAFGGLLYLLMTNPYLVEHVSTPLVRFALGGRWNWVVVLAAFMVVSWLADYWARHATSRGVQYLGLGCYVVAEALVFVPLLAIVEWKTAAILARGGAEPHIIRDAACVTFAIFTALTLSVLVTRRDFSFLRSGLFMASGAAFAMIALSIGFGFNLGLVFSVGLVVLAAAYILYQTSQVLAHYDTRQHVAASLALFSSVALMLWYVIRIFTRARA